MVAPCAPIMPPYSCSCMSSSPSGFTWAFRWWGGRVRSTQWSWILFSGTTLHPWWNDRCIPWSSSEQYSWFGRWCVHHTQHQRTIWRARWKGECGSEIRNKATFSYRGSLTSLEALHDITLWSPLQDIMWTPILSNQYLLPVAQLVPYTQMYSQCGTGLQELIQQNLQHKETLCLLHLTVLWCLNSMEANNDSPTIQTSGDIGVDGIMELDPGPMENDNDSDSGDPENCSTGTMCYDLVPSYLVPSDHMISAFQQGHQAFPLVKLKDNFTNALGDTYHSLLPMVPICLDHTFAQNPNLHSHTALFDHFHAMPSSSKHLAINMGRYHFYNESPNEYSFTDEDLGLTTDESDFDHYDFYYNLEELQETSPKMDDDTISNMQSPTCIKRVANQLHTVHATNLMEMQVQVPKEVADDTSDALEPTSTSPCHHNNLGRGVERDYQNPVLPAAAIWGSKLSFPLGLLPCPSHFLWSHLTSGNWHAAHQACQEGDGPWGFADSLWQVS